MRAAAKTQLGRSPAPPVVPRIDTAGSTAGVVGRLASALRYCFRRSVTREGKAMPFDGVAFAFSDDRLNKMDKVIELLATPEKWCKAALRTPDGRYCIRGAIMAVDGLGTLQSIVLQAINELTGVQYRRIESFNDYPHTEHAQVLEILARARLNLVLRQSRSTAPAPVGWRARLQAWVNRLSTRWPSRRASVLPMGAQIARARDGGIPRAQ